ncbi:MAG: hypothetical protein EZS28_042632 [Streblomastix strix]|uniref:Uncharacterized protein n=1 Tax=Streblomastix strix TaxID=222440 RepID=A0A5J4TW62_9EUKA|nr:MAG: hypothetical protein EZS28_042632 [Streblomastix strix]
MLQFSDEKAQSTVDLRIALSIGSTRKEGDDLKGKNKEVIRLRSFDSYEKMKRFLLDALTCLYEVEFPLVVNSKVIDVEDEN